MSASAGGLAFLPQFLEKSLGGLGDDGLDRKAKSARDRPDQLHANINRCLLSGDGNKSDAGLACDAKNVAQVRDAFVHLKALHDLIYRRPDGLDHFNAQTASRFPGSALHPADFAEKIAIAPAVDVHINGENSGQRTIEHDLKVKRLHSACECGGECRAHCSTRSRTCSVREFGTPKI